MNNTNITPRFAIFLLIVGIVTAGVEYMVIDNYTMNLATESVYDKDKTIPFYSDVDINFGQQRLKAEVGMVTLNLTELDWMFKKFEYIPDTYEYQSWKLPSVFIEENGGDCEDFMLFALATLDRQQYDLKPILGTYFSTGHAFMLVKEKATDSVYLVDNGGVKKMKSDSWDGSNLPYGYKIDCVYNSMLEKPFLGVF